MRQALMACFGLRQFDQQLAYRGVACVFCCLAVIALRFELHVLGELAHLLEAERPGQPQRLLRVQEALDVLAADQRQVVSELLAIEIEQHRAVMHFLVGHLVEYFCRGRELLAQTFRKTAIDAAILFLVGDCEGQNFLFAEIGKPFQTLPRGSRCIYDIYWNHSKQGFWVSTGWVSSKGRGIKENDGAVASPAART